MFLFKCCQQVQTGVGYEVKRTNQSNQQIIEFVSNLNQFDPSHLRNSNLKITKIKKSEFQQLFNDLKSSNKKFQDHEFPPNDISLGNIDNIKSNKWKRISEVIKSPALFSGKIEPKDTTQGTLRNCYFLSALAALAEKPERIFSIFQNQTYNQVGIYQVKLRINGQVQQIIVDDYIPVNQNGDPLFCQPNKNEFWVLILEKAWAKIHGSYANIIFGIPSQVFKAVTFAPSQMLLIKEVNQEREKLWNQILYFTKKQYPVCCITSDKSQSQSIGPNQSYSLLKAANLEGLDSEYKRVVKLRNPWGEMNWEGQGNASDKTFWNNISTSSERKQFEHKSEGNGIFFMTFSDFCRYFSQIHVCMSEKNANYISETLFCNKKNGNMFEFVVEKKGTYSIELHQEQIKQEQLNHSKETQICRSTMLLIKNNRKQECQFDFINGSLKTNDNNVLITENLEPGTYLIYAKIDPSLTDGSIPEKCVVSIYSTEFTKLQRTEQIKYPNLLKKVFLEHAKKYKKNKYNNDLMWISSKLLFAQGGYAYIAMGNDLNSNKKFVIKFDEDEFDKMGFILKKDFKGKGNGQILEVAPGEQKIILARVKNDIKKHLKFPPSIGIKMELIS